MIMINTLGLTGEDCSLREQEYPGKGLDGYTYFGSYSSVPVQDAIANDIKVDNPMMAVEQVVNDFVIPNKQHETVDKSHKGRHFQIWFDIPTKRYYIKDLGIGFGVFKKMEYGKTILKDNMLINIGEAYIVVNLYPLGADQQG